MTTYNTLKLCSLIVYSKFHKIYKFEHHVTRNDVIMMSLPKQWKQWENVDLRGTKKIYIVQKVLMRAIQKCNFYWIWATVSKVMGIYVKFHHDRSHVTWPSLQYSTILFLPNSIWNFRKVTKLGGNWLKNQKVTGQKTKLGVENTPPPPVLIRLIWTTLGIVERQLLHCIWFEK